MIHVHAVGSLGVTAGLELADQNELHHRKKKIIRKYIINIQARSTTLSSTWELVNLFCKRFYFYVVRTHVLGLLVLA